MNIQNLKRRIYFIGSQLILIAAFAVSMTAQTTVFTYQGNLTDAGNPAIGNYLLQFKLYDAISGGTQIGATISGVAVTATNGVFTTQLNFGVSAFPGADRFLEIAVKKNTGDPFTTLSPRQQIASSPYSIRTLSAAQADVALDSNKLGGVAANQYVTTATVGNSFIKNATTQQTGNFNINGNGIVGDSFGIGTTPNSGFKFDMNGNARLTTANGAVISFASPNAESGMSTIFNGGRADIRFDGSTLKLVVGASGGIPPSTNGVNISSSGNVGIGKDFTVDGRTQLIGDTQINGSLFLITLPGGGNTALCRSPTTLIATCSSSLRYKTNIASFNSGLKAVNQLRPISFDWKEGGMKDVGFGAEDVAKINPLLVTYNAKGEVEGVKYDRLSVVFVNAFKEQQAQIEQQKSQIEQQQQQIDGLKEIVCGLQPQAKFCQ